MIRSEGSSFSSLRSWICLWIVCIKDATVVLLPILRFFHLSKVVITSAIIFAVCNASVGSEICDTYGLTMLMRRQVAVDNNHVNKRKSQVSHGFGLSSSGFLFVQRIRSGYRRRIHWFFVFALWHLTWLWLLKTLHSLSLKILNSLLPRGLLFLRHSKWYSSMSCSSRDQLSFGLWLLLNLSLNYCMPDLRIRWCSIILFKKGTQLLSLFNRSSIAMIPWYAKLTTINTSHQSKHKLICRVRATTGSIFNCLFCSIFNCLLQIWYISTFHS